MSVHVLTVRLPGFSIAVSMDRPNRRQSNAHSSTPTQATGEQSIRREMLQARQMLTWQSMRQ